MCSHRTEILYIAIWRSIKQIVPGFGDNLETVIGDFEKAAMNAIRALIIVRILGCWFHYCQVRTYNFKVILCEIDIKSCEKLF